jgi:steroid delta-isomerase-like uncharacterized protein
MSEERNTPTEAARAVVRRNTEEVQSRGDFDVFEELFADDFVDHTPQPNTTPDKDGVRRLYHTLRAAFPDFHAEIHWQAADGELVTTYKTYHGTHQGTFLGVAPTGRRIHFETVDVMRVHDGKITELGGWRIYSPSCSNSAPGPLRHKRRSLAAIHGRRSNNAKCKSSSRARVKIEYS